MIGLTFNGKHSKDLGLAMRSINRQVLPSSRDEYEYVVGRDGSMHFEDALNDRFIEVEFVMVSHNIRNTRLMARQVAAWLFTRQRVELIFDDEPDVLYMAKVANQIDLEPLAQTGKFVVMFRCLPYKELAYWPDEIILDSDILLDSDIRFLDQYTYDIQGSRTIEINNAGAVEAQPIIQVDGSFDSLRIKIANQTLEYTDPHDGVLIIDNHKMQAYSGSENKLRRIEGDFPLTVPAGINNINVSGSNLDALIYFRFKPKYL